MADLINDGRMKITYKDINDLVPYENNPRTISDEAIEKVANSLMKFGWKQPVVIDTNNIIVVGHTRVLSAKKIGIREVPCVIADDLTEEEVRAYRLADNKLNELTYWDQPLLSAEMEDLAIDMSEFGFEAPDMEVNIDDFFESDSGSKTKAPKMVTCPHCGAEFEL